MTTQTDFTAQFIDFAIKKQVLRFGALLVFFAICLLSIAFC
jgi:hypothetical protein